MQTIKNEFYQYIIIDKKHFQIITEGITPSKPNAANNIINVIFKRQKNTNNDATIAILKLVRFNNCGDIENVYTPSGEIKYLKRIEIESNRMNYDYIENEVYKIINE